MKNRRAALYRQIEESTIDALGKEGLALERARKVAAYIADVLAINWGGQTIYFPQDVARASEHRATKIMADFTGRNYGELAAKYGYTEQGIRRLIQRFRRADQKELA